MDVLWHFINFFSADGIDESGLSSSVSSNQTVLSTFGEFDSCIFNKKLVSSGNGNSRKMNIGLVALRFVVHNTWWWNLLLGGDLGIDLCFDSGLLGVFSLSKLFILLFHPFCVVSSSFILSEHFLLFFVAVW
jgi:hypothetical protein